MAEPGLRINGKFYPLAKSYTLGEAETIERITGMEPVEFVKALAEQNKKQSPKVLLAFVWHAMHRENPAVTPDEVRALEFEDLVWEGLDEAGVADPPPATSVKSSGSSLPTAETANGSQVTELAPIRAVSGPPH